VSQTPPDRRNLWALTILCLLRLRPMHPYEIQRLIREYHKDEFLDLKRGSLYHAIALLRDGGLIDPIETTRAGRWPERTVYRLTESGEREMRNWLRQLLAQPLRDTTQFFAALSFLSVLPPAEVAEHLQERLAALDAEITGLTAVLKQLVPRIGRLVLVEVEYARAMRRAERAWVQSLIADLRTRKLHWDPEAWCQATAQSPPQEQSQPPSE
jgi:DNA-binding PadR family transcriptional regulator